MHKNPMYECQVFFPEGFPKKWKYVTDLKSFAAFLSKSHPSWKYFNVYQKGTKIYLKRFYPGNLVPKVLGLLLLLLTQKFTFDKTFAVPSNTYENTSSKTTPSTSTNDFNNHATILTQGGASV
jgi:hypothetical protein